MNTRRIAVCFLALWLTSTAAHAEDVRKVVVGAYYYAKGILSDDKVQVIEVDYASGRVKILNTSSKEVDWIAASALITTSESVKRDMDRIDLTAKILQKLFETDNTSGAQQTWVPGKTHPQYPKVVAAAERNKWVPVAGYDWVNMGSSWDVVWVPDRPHPDYRNVVCSATEGKWAPAPGFEWVAMNQTWEVRWKPGAPHGQHPHVFAAAEAGKWTPESGYGWEDPAKSWNVRWMPGQPHSQHPHVLTSTKQGEWQPESGYQWKVPNTLWDVRWTPGTVHSTTYPRIVAYQDEGYWMPAPGYEWKDKDKWLVQWRAGMVHPLQRNLLSVAAPDVWENQGGLGVMLDFKDGWAIVSNTVPGAPAAAAKLQKGWWIVGIDGSSTVGLTLDEVVQKLAGTADTAVKVEFFDPVAKARKQINLVRAKYLIGQ